MTSHAVYRDKAFAVGQVLFNTSDTDLGLLTRGDLTAADYVQVKRTVDANNDGFFETTTGFTLLSELTSYFQTGDAGNVKVIDPSATGSPRLSLFQTTTERAFLEWINATSLLNISSDGAIVFAPDNNAAARFHTGTGHFTVGTADDDAACIGGFHSDTLAMIVPLSSSGTFTGLTPAGTNGAIGISSTEDKVFIWNGSTWRNIPTSA